MNRINELLLENEDLENRIHYLERVINNLRDESKGWERLYRFEKNEVERLDKKIGELYLTIFKLKDDFERR